MQQCPLHKSKKNIHCSKQRALLVTMAYERPAVLLITAHTLNHTSASHDLQSRFSIIINMNHYHYTTSDRNRAVCFGVMEGRTVYLLDVKKRLFCLCLTHPCLNGV